VVSSPEGRLPAVAARCVRAPERARAKTASPIPVTGIPRSRAALTVQRPVPFWPAASTMTSMSGRPVAASVCESTSAVISMRYESRSPAFQVRKMSAISAGSRPAA
jgi:hypothetical protein